MEQEKFRETKFVTQDVLRVFGVCITLPLKRKIFHRKQNSFICYFKETSKKYDSKMTCISVFKKLKI